MLAKGILCRTQARIDNLEWNLNTKELDLTISSLVDQTLSLVMQRGIETANSDSPGVLADFQSGRESVNVRLQAGRPVTIHLTLGSHLPSDWITAM